MALINVTAAKVWLSRLLNRVTVAGEIVVTQAGRPAARWIPSGKPKRKPGSLKGKIWISPDFNKEDKEIEALFYDSPIEPS